jgi:hypothetical protein
MRHERFKTDNVPGGLAMTGELTLSAMKLWRERFQGLPLYCGNETPSGQREPGDWGNWTERETTPDQARIENYIAPLIAGKDMILHIGIGNSKFADRFCSQVGTIVGITIEASELSLARTYKLENYYTLLLNKFSTQFTTMLEPGFRFIVDNNPSSYACCFFHFFRMMQTYRHLLRVGGALLTDREGLAHYPEGGNSRTGFDLDDLSAFAELLDMTVRDVDGSVYAIKRAGD